MGHPPPRRDLEVRGAEMALQQKYTDPQVATAALASMLDTYNVLTPVRSVGNVPHGHAIVPQIVVITQSAETYKVDGGKLALSKSALDKIATAAGISWDPDRSGRVDDGSDPAYCHFRAVGTVRDPDGTTRTITGERVIDLRPGGADAEGASERQIAQQRKFLLPLAESKAKNRAIRQACSVRSSYSPAELQKPFVALKLVDTGEYEDPVLRRAWALKQMGYGDAAVANLFGPAPAGPALQVLDGGAAAPALSATPPAQAPADPLDVSFVEDDEQGPPVDSRRGEDPVDFRDLPPDAQVAELTAMAARKGKLGEGEGQISEDVIRRWQPFRRFECWNKLVDLPDVAPAPPTDEAGQVIPDWMR